jgi:luciferase family oxidoreductase group 1
MAKLKLSVVDQSPIRMNGTAADALNETVKLAKAVESFGYSRYWVAEHHNIANFAGTSPEILIGQIAANTEHITVGSGGVMLTHYSAFKVAEVFNMLNLFFPGRIELGLGRAPGSDQITAAALAFPSSPLGAQHYPRQVTDILSYFTDSHKEENLFSNLTIGQKAGPIPNVWLLGSKYESAYMAAQMGLPFAYAHFFGMGSSEGPLIVDAYRQNFVPSQFLSKPLVNVGVHVICAETKEEAERLAASRNLGRLFSITGRAKGIPSPEYASNYQYMVDEQEFVQNYAKNCVDGDPETVANALNIISDNYETNDLSIVTICHSYQDRENSYKLVAQACGINIH